MIPRPLRPAEPQRQADAPRSSEGQRLPPVRTAERAAERAERSERVAAPPLPPVAQMPSPPPAPPPPSAESAEANLAEMAQRLEAALRRPAADPANGSAALRAAARSEPAPAQAAPAKTSFENLEDEMASLLGRPKSSQ